MDKLKMSSIKKFFVISTLSVLVTVFCVLAYLHFTGQPQNRCPVAFFSYLPESPTTGDVVRFTENSTDPDGEVFLWHWDFGDGTTSDVQNPTHIYSTPGFYVVTLTVEDSKGARNSYTLVLEVRGSETPQDNDSGRPPTENQGAEGSETPQDNDSGRPPTVNQEKTFQNFEEGNGTPGAYFQNIWHTASSFESLLVHSGSRSIKVTTDVGGGTIRIMAASPSGYFNLENVSAISVWIYDTQGNNTVQLRLKDIDGDGGRGPDENYIWSTMTSRENQWAKITWDMSYYPDVEGLDMDKISSIELYMYWNGTYYFDDVTFLESGTVEVWISSEDGKYKLTKVRNKSFEEVGNSQADYIFGVDPTVTYQSILGFGSSLESSSCYNMSLLNSSTRESVIENLVSPDTGIGMNLMRICIGTSDFTGEEWYTYDDMPEGQIDPNLEHFSIAKDREYIIPAIKIALQKNPELKVFASPWSPPAWMKDSKSITGGGSLLREYYEVYARYFVKFIRAYEAEGIPIYAVTVQNEPGFEWVHPTCKWTLENERDFVKYYLGPAFEREGISTKIWIYDWNFDLYTWPDEILDDVEAARYIDGTGFHHYGGGPVAMTYLHQNHPDKHIYFTEGSTFNTSGAVKIISYLRNWARSYNAWVTLLDEDGKPNNGPFHASPTCIVLRKDMTLNYRYDYYMYGQFMKFISRNSLRIFSNDGDQTVSNVAFKTPDKKIVFVIANAGDSSKCFKIIYANKAIWASIAPKSVITFRWDF
ncbi:MAG: PKD domain-containing protein [Candidatus Hadarchaeales archaeon]